MPFNRIISFSIEYFSHLDDFQFIIETKHKIITKQMIN